MKRILLTGMSGVGKSSVLGELSARGHKSVDTDDGYCEIRPDGEPLWREGRMTDLLDTEDADFLFVGGCVRNQGKFYPRFDHVILLSAPKDVIVERLRTRTNNPFGKSQEQLAFVLECLETVEPLLRRGASHEIRTDIPLAQVVEEVLRVATDG